MPVLNPHHPQEFTHVHAHSWSVQDESITINKRSPSDDTLSYVTYSVVNHHHDHRLDMMQSVANALQVSVDLGESGDYFYSLFIKRNPLQPLAPRPDPYGPQIENRNREAWCCLSVLVFFLVANFRSRKIPISSEFWPWRMTIATRHPSLPRLAAGLYTSLRSISPKPWQLYRNNSLVDTELNYFVETAQCDSRRSLPSPVWTPGVIIPPQRC